MHEEEARFPYSVAPKHLDQKAQCTLQNVTQTQKCVLHQKKPTLNKCVFKCFAKVAGPIVRSLNSTGNSFQQLGPATVKALKPQSVLWQDFKIILICDSGCGKTGLADRLAYQRFFNNCKPTNMYLVNLAAPWNIGFLTIF